MTTLCTAPILTEPLKFLGATVLSFNCSLGLGPSTESSLNVDLIEDCEEEDSFTPADESVLVGAPVYFPSNNPNPMAFSFGGVLMNWTVSQSPSGKTFNVKVSDPRQLLDNAIVIIDSYVGPPESTINYFNAYAHYEQSVLQGDCGSFGTSGSTERGMPYNKIMNALLNMGVVICSPTGYNFRVDITSFPGYVDSSVPNSRLLPEWFRIAGPGVSLLELLRQACDVLAYDFYVELQYIDGENVITIGLIDLNSPPGSFGTIVAAYNGTATDINYGQELRNDKTKTIIFGEQVHYLTVANQLDFFFGEDLRDGQMVSIVPHARDECGFWIYKNIDQLDLSLNDPIGGGPYAISELDIRCAMSSFEMWATRTFDINTPGSFNVAVRNKFPDAVGAGHQAVQQNLMNIVGGIENIAAIGQIDAGQAPNIALQNRTLPEVAEEIRKIHTFINNLGSTYYGKQYISLLNQKICYAIDIDGENTGLVFSDTPATAGGWLEFGVPLLGLSDPDLGFFRADDNRVNCFGVFASSNDDVEVEEDGEAVGDNPNAEGIGAELGFGG